MRGVGVRMGVGVAVDGRGGGDNLKKLLSIDGGWVG